MSETFALVASGFSIGCAFSMAVIAIDAILKVRRAKRSKPVDWLGAENLKRLRGWDSVDTSHSLD